MRTLDNYDCKYREIFRKFQIFGQVFVFQQSSKAYCVQASGGLDERVPGDVQPAVHRTDQSC